jgi:hypothetical protein
MDSASERTPPPVVTTHRPTRIQGPAPKGDELSLEEMSASSVALINSGGECGPTTTQNGHQERNN